jgi:hypothetical protein
MTEIGVLERQRDSNQTDAVKLEFIARHIALELNEYRSWSGTSRRGTIRAVSPLHDTDSHGFSTEAEALAGVGIHRSRQAAKQSHPLTRPP